MRKKLIIFLSIVMIFTIAVGVLADEEDSSKNAAQSIKIKTDGDNTVKKSMGSFNLKPPKSVTIEQDDFIPIDKVADVLNIQLNWNLSGEKVQGNFGSNHFTSDRYIITSGGKLYLPQKVFSDNFDIHIEIQGNTYIIYKYIDNYQNNNLELVIKTDNKNYKRHDSMAVSILMKNRSNQQINLRYTSGKRYDLVLKRYNREVWRLSEEKGYIDAMNSMHLSPDEYLLYAELINPSDSAYLHNGNYKLYAEVVTNNGQKLTSNVVDIQINN
ncbi:MAG: BsuPI-related putative proteinase inhibitor [Halothermotrichaceae bacterium]